MKLQISVEGRAYEVSFEVEDDGTADSEVASFAASVAQSLLLPDPILSVGRPGDENERRVCRSPVRGIVKQVWVEAGTDVEPDDLMFVVEAMKMETRVTATVAGRMKSVQVALGDAVKVRQILGEFE